jgi:predicted dehydrogenase
MPALRLDQKPPLPQAPRPIVLIGAGGIVRDAHLPAYQKAGFIAAGIYDLNAQRALDLAGRFGIPQVYPSLEAAAAEAAANAVFDVAVPAAAILRVLPKLPDGRAVLIQKPLGENLEQARQIASLCHRKQLRAAVNFQLRYAPYVLAARSLIDQGRIGTLHSMEVRLAVFTPWRLWRFLEGTPRVEILYHSIHYLDLLRSFLGEPRGVYAKSLKHPATPQLGPVRSTILLDYGDMLRAVVSANHGHVFGLRHQESYIRWEGTGGAIIAKMGLLMDYPQGMPDEFEFCSLQEKRPPQWEKLRLEGSWFPDAFIGTMGTVMRWADDEKDVAPTAVDDAVKTMAVVEAAYRSSERGGEPIAD